MDKIIMSEIFESEECKDFVRCCFEVKPYAKSNLSPPSEMDADYQDSLHEYRAYLDNLGIKMPKGKKYAIQK